MRKLATSFDVYSCYANPRKITDKEKAAEDLAAFFDLDKDEILKSLHKDKAFVWIKRHITEEEAQEFNDSNLKALGLGS